MKQRGPMALFLVILLLAGLALPAAALDVTNETNAAAGWLMAAKPQPALGDEIAVIALTRGGYLNPAQPEAEAYAWQVILHAETGGTDSQSATDSALQALALAALGLDPAAYAPALLDAARDTGKLAEGGLYASWATMLLFGPAGVEAGSFDGAGHAASLAQQHNGDGGFGAAAGEVTNALDTALAVAALAPYTYGDDTINDVVLFAHFWHQLNSNDFGGYNMGDQESVEATAYTILSVDCLGYDPEFISYEAASMTAYLTRYQNEAGWFSYGDSPDEELTALCLLALTAKMRYDRGKTAVFDYSDVVQRELGVAQTDGSGTGEGETAPASFPATENTETEGTSNLLVAGILLGVVVLLLLAAVVVYGRSKKTRTRRR